jgi:hypothetical protein
MDASVWMAVLPIGPFGRASRTTDARLDEIDALPGAFPPVYRYFEIISTLQTVKFSVNETVDPLYICMFGKKKKKRS